MGPDPVKYIFRVIFAKLEFELYNKLKMFR